VQLGGGTSVQVSDVVVCAGAYSQRLLGTRVWSDAGLPPLHFGRGTAVLVRAAALPELPHAIRTPNRALACGLHVVPRAGGAWYVGSTNLFGTNLDAATGPTCGELHTLLGAWVMSSCLPFGSSSALITVSQLLF
jgi:glycine oxidase